MNSLLRHIQQSRIDDVITSSMTASNQASDSLDQISSISSVE